MVLPVPVCKRAITATPVLIRGMVSDWMGMANAKLISVMALSSFGLRLSWKNGVSFLNSV